MKALCIFTCLVASLAVTTYGRTNIDPVEKWAWGTNVGWINFAPQSGGVSVYATHLEGYAWGENVGWIRLGTHEGGGSHTYENSAADNYGVNRDANGNLSGYAWGTNIGWINFNPTHGGVRINPATNQFEGYAWGENVGWISFRGDDYGVLFTGFPPAPPPPSGAGSNLAPVPDAGPDQVVRVGETAILDGTGSRDGEDVAPGSTSPQGVTEEETGDGSELSFRWGFSIRYMSGGRPVYMIPEGSDCFGTCENFDQPTASFVPDIAGDYTLTLYVTDEDGECLTDRVTITAIDDPDDSPEPSDSADFSVKRVLCYPSPFADQISFGFIGSGVPDAIHVTVYDLSGKLVWQVEARGVSVTTWDGTSVRGDRLANGGYICVIRIAGGGKVHTERTMIFIRR